MKRLLLFNLLWLFFCVTFGQTKVLHCGKMLDVRAGEIRNEVTIIVEKERIQSIQNGYIKPRRGQEVIDLKDKTVLPGLMDMHVHLEGETNKNSYIQRFTLNEADIAFNSTLYARRTLMAGFTTVRDLGGSGVNTSLRRAITSGIVVGPRVFSAGKSIATTGGHADPTNGRSRDLTGDPGPAEGVVNGPDDARKAVRQRYKNVADVIKITATGGVLSVAKDGQGPQFTLEELKAIVETAKDYGFVTAAHAHGPEGMKRAIIAGINTIEHGTKMTEEVMDLMIKHGTYHCPTITAGKAVAEYAQIEGYYPALVVPKALEIGPLIQNTFSKSYKKGVKILFGTDAGVFPHGQNAREFGYMVEAGMPAIEAIRSSTLVPAELLGVDDDLGALEEGKIADIVAVADNPLSNVKTLENVLFVMKEGKVFKQLQ